MRGGDRQADLFAFAAARHGDPDTSRAAGSRAPSLRARDRRSVLLAHANHPRGLTDFELGALLGRQQTSVGKRRGELRDGGLIEDSEQRRPAPSGSPAIVWRITPHGVSMAASLRAAMERGEDA